MAPLLLALIVGVAFNAALALVILILYDRQRRQQRARLARARGIAAPDQTAEPTDAPKARSERPRLSAFAALDRRFAEAGMRLRSDEAMVQCAIGVFGLFALLVLVAGVAPPLALALSLALPPTTLALALRIARARYVAAFTHGLPEALDVFARGLRAGRPVADSLSIVVENAKPGPLQREFTRCRDEIRMGAALQTSLDRLSVRMPTPEVCFFAVATALQSETGGNLIETMESLAQQLRERRKLRRKAKALSSEARASAVILAALPFAVGTLLAVLNLGYIAPLWTDPRGRVMALLALCSIGMGIWTMIRMGRLNV